MAKIATYQYFTKIESKDVWIQATAIKDNNKSIECGLTLCLKFKLKRGIAPKLSLSELCPLSCNCMASISSLELISLMILVWVLKPLTLWVMGLKLEVFAQLQL